MASKICEGLFLGSQLDVEDKWQDNTNTKDLDFSHILTVSSVDLQHSNKEKFTCKWVKVDDNIGQDLLTHFDGCIDFIEEGRKEKGCIVHCIAGVSRSATVVAAYLMRKENLSLDLALEVIKRSRPRICPNSGFMYQLYLFEKMGCKLDLTNAEFKYFKLTTFAKSLREAGDKILNKKDLTHDPHEVKNNEVVNYKCRKCRRTLFRLTSFMSHKVGVGEAAFDWRGAVEVDGSEEVCTKSIFIEPIEWMLDSIQVVDGKIHCPKCHIKLGSFNWVGERCPCGRWVTPAFHIDTGKVDKTIPLSTTEHPIVK